MAASNLSVRFINKSVGATSFSWSFGDGTSSPLENPEHTYLTGGAYIVTLTANGPSGQGKVSHTIITVGVLNDVLLSTASGDQLANVNGDFIAVPPP